MVSSSPFVSWIAYATTNPADSAVDAFLLAYHWEVSGQKYSGYLMPGLEDFNVSPDASGVALANSHN